MLNAQKSDYYLVMRLQEMLIFFLLCISISIFSSINMYQQERGQEVKRKERGGREVN